MGATAGRRAAHRSTIPRGWVDERPKNQRLVVVYLPGIMGSELTQTANAYGWLGCI